MSTSSKICATVELSKEEFTTGTRRSYLNSRQFVATAVISFAIGLATLWMAIGSRGSLSVPLLLLVWSPTTVLLIPNLSILSKPTVLQRHEICFGESGSQHRGASYQFERPWSSYRSALLFDEMIILTYAMGNAVILPRSAFNSKSDVDEFLDLVQRKIAKVRTKTS